MARITFNVLAATVTWLAMLVLHLSNAAGEPAHGLSAFGQLKYPAGFAHFDYVNPDAPRGGRFSEVGGQTYDSFNPFILRGDAAAGLNSLVFESLMVAAADEPDSVYGLIARSADLAPDRLSVVFELRPEARFSDGSAITAEDVAFSFKTLRTKGHPNYRTLLRDVVGVDVLGPLTVKYRFTGTQLRDLPLVVASLPVLSKAYYTKVDFTQTTLVPPLGSGPYKIADFKQGRYVSYRRRSDYWGAKLNVSRGRFNFDEVRYEYFRDRTASLESFKAGDYDFREEFTSRDWATAYNIPHVKDKRIVLRTLPDENPSGAQGFFINTRRDKFKNSKVRRALDLVFDFEWTNSHLFYGLYTRTASYFENSELKATGPPSAAERAILAPFRDKLPPELFAREPYSPPVTDGSGTDRTHLREAVKLLAEAGWTIRSEAMADPSCGFICQTLRTVGLGQAPTQQVLRNREGERLEIEFLATEPTGVRLVAPYVRNLKRIGIDARVRRVDAAQYVERIKRFDFDISTRRFIMRLTPGAELNNYFGSRAAKLDGSVNLAGISDPVIDALIVKVLEAKTRSNLIAATRALDRVLRAGHYWVPHWYKAAHHIAFWNRYSWPEVKPKYDRGVLDTWWYDAAKAATLERNKATFAPKEQPSAK